MENARDWIEICFQCCLLFNFVLYNPPQNHFVFGYDLPIRNLLHILKTLDPQHDVSGRVFTL